jgi:amicyanin
MKSFAPLIIAAVVIVLGVSGIIVYMMSQDNQSAGNNSSAGSSEKADQNGESVDASNAEMTDTVSIKSFEFGPKAIEVKVGTTVTWTNEDGVQHNVVTEDGAPEEIKGKLLNKGETFTYTFKKAGTYNYFCAPHPYMKGTVVVTE